MEIGITGGTHRKENPMTLAEISSTGDVCHSLKLQMHKNYVVSSSQWYDLRHLRYRASDE